MKHSKGIPPSLLDVSNYINDGLKVLFVEDSEADFELMCYRLKRGGLTYKANRVENTAELRTCLEHEEWDIVICDHRLHGFSSDEALQLLHNTGLDIPFIIVSGSMNEETALEAMRLGADDYLLKSNLVRLVPSIQRALKASVERRNLAITEHAQRESERRFSAISRNIPGIILQMQSGGKLAHPLVPFVSEGALPLFGVPPRVFLEDASYFFSQFDEHDVARLYELLLEAQQNTQHLTWEGRTKARNGTEQRWVLLNASGKPSGDSMLWDGVLLDISLRKKAEHEVQSSQQELRHLATEFEKRREEERTALAREIHDDLGGSLTSLKNNISWLERNHAPTPEIQIKLDDMKELVSHLLSSSQRLSKDLRPSILDCGLIPALGWQVNDFQKRNGLKCTFKSNLEQITLETTINTTLFRILQESLTNIVKHAQATEVHVELFITEEEISLEIRDNGLGIDHVDKLKQNAYGLRGMRERITAFDGWIDISGSKNKGTTVMVLIPVEKLRIKGKTQ